MDAVSGQNALQLMLNASDAMLSMRSAIHYKYNPSMRYVVELYPIPPRSWARCARACAHRTLRCCCTSASFISCGPGWSARIWKARRAAARRREGGIPAACFCPECRRQRGGWPRYCGLCGAVRRPPENFFDHLRTAGAPRAVEGCYRSGLTQRLRPCSRLRAGMFIGSAVRRTALPRRFIRQNMRIRSEMI